MYGTNSGGLFPHGTDSLARNNEQVIVHVISTGEVPNDLRGRPKLIFWIREGLLSK